MWLLKGFAKRWMGYNNFNRGLPLVCKILELNWVLRSTFYRNPVAGITNKPIWAYWNDPKKYDSTVSSQFDSKKLIF